MFTDTVEVLTYPTVSDRGRLVPDYTAEPAAAPIVGVDLQPGDSTELAAQRREGSAIRWTVYVPAEVAPAAPALTSKSILRVHGRRYQVDGDPGDWGSGPLGHLVLRLVSWDPS